MTNFKTLKSIGDELKYIRKGLGLSQKKVSEIANINKRQVSRLERGKNTTLKTYTTVYNTLKGAIDSKEIADY